MRGLTGVEPQPPSRLAALAAFAALALALVPVLGTPRVSDDVINYSFRWLSFPDLIRESLEEIRFWILSAGRVFVFSTVMKNAVFQVFETTLAYKVFLVAMNLAAAGCVFVYARLVTRSWLVPVAAILALPLLIQLRDYHDPIVSFNGLFQLSAILIFASLACHHRFIRSTDSRWLYACAAAFIANLFVYELAALTVPLVWMQERVLDQPRPKPYRGTRIMLVILAVYIALVVASKVLGATVFGYTGSLYGAGNPRLIPETLVKQLLAVVPFSYSIFRPHNGAWDVPAAPEPVAWLAAWQFFAASAAFVGAAWFALARASQAERTEPPLPPDGVRTLGIIAIALVVIPAALVSVIGRYQGAFNAGNGYSFVYLQELGAALFAAIALVMLLRRFRRIPGWAIPAFCVVLGVASAGNLVNNASVASKLTQAWSGQYPWAAMLTSEGFRTVCGDVGLVDFDRKPWTEYRVIEHAGFRLARDDEINAKGQRAPTQVCVARSVRVLGRSAAAYARLRLPWNEYDADFRSRIFLTVPLEPGENLKELPLGDNCTAAPWGATGLGARAFAEGRYGLFALEGDRSTIDFKAKGFALPCEKKEG